MPYYFTAHFETATGPWKANCALVTHSRREGGKYKVYCYRRDGLYEHFVSDTLCEDVNTALDAARAFGKEPDSLDIETDEHRLRWSSHYGTLEAA